MPQPHPAIRLERQRANLKRLESKAKRLATLIASRKRSIRGLERSVAHVGPAPPPEPKPARQPRGKRLDDPLLADLQAWAGKAARALGVKVPTVRWTGTKGACSKALRAHIHDHDGGRYVRDRKTGRLRFRQSKRGNCCVNRDYHVSMLRHDPQRAMHLMAHEATHLVRRHGHGSAHGPTFLATMRQCLVDIGEAPLEATAHAKAVEPDDAQVAA